MNAERLLMAIQETCSRLATLPSRGAVPKELRLLGMTEFREILCVPYRIIYRTSARTVVIYFVLDGRRDMQTLLQRRLLR